jgi:glucokinase
VLFQEKKYIDTIPTKSRAYLVADIGGTNANFGVFKNVHGVARLLYSMHFKSKEITHFTEVIKQVLAYARDMYRLEIPAACVAAAGVIQKSRTYVKPTNLTFAIDATEIVRETMLDCVLLTNDFEVIGYGLRLLDQDTLVHVQGGQAEQFANKAILGAGTGLGKCILVWHEGHDHYIPVASEGGHADFAPHSQEELELVHFIQEKENRNCPISWEQVLSGTGIQRLYAFYKRRNQQKKANAQIQANGLMPDEIFNSRHLDDYCWHTFELYAKLYARCAKNFALDALALGGIYIAGGIASKNLSLFEQKQFLQEFTDCGKMEAILKKIPVYVITDYNVSLYGAAEYMRIEGLCD